jgi:hypothetical protein
LSPCLRLERVPRWRTHPHTPPGRPGYRAHWCTFGLADERRRAREAEEGELALEVEGYELAAVIVAQLGAGDHREAAKFEKLASARALRERFADTATLDREARELEYGFKATARHRWLGLLRRVG